jgi:hypothetical protein
MQEHMRALLAPALALLLASCVADEEAPTLVDLQAQPTRQGGEVDVRWYSGSRAAAPSASAPTYTVDDATGVAQWSFIDARHDRIAIAADDLRSGDVIRGFLVRANTRGAKVLQAKLWRRSGSGAPTQIGATLTHSGSSVDKLQAVEPTMATSVDEFIPTARCALGDPALYSVGVVVER